MPVAVGDETCPLRQTSPNAVLGQLAILGEPETSVSGADSATHAKGKLGCRSLIAIALRELEP